MPNRDETDVLIIGSGAGGAPLALRLSQAGMRVLLLEKGPRYARQEYRHDEVFAATHPEFFVPSLKDDPHVLVKTAGPGEAEQAKPELTTVGWIGHCLGGGTVRMGGSLYRFHPDDFRVASRFGPYEETADWPYGYEDLEPYYALAEQEIGISGEAGRNPFDGPRSNGYPMPPLESHRALARSFEQACARCGLHPFPTPLAINSIAYRGRSACAYCDLCAGYGCAIGAKGSMQEALIARAEQTRGCDVRTRAMVTCLTSSPDGRVSGCLYTDEDGAEHEVRARVVCVCCSAVESARLLLMSSSSRWPNGLANGSGLVGRHLQFHIGAFGRAAFRRDRHPDKSLDEWDRFLVRSLMDYYVLPPGVSDWSKGGLHLFELERVQPLQMAQRVALRSAPGPIWGRELKDRLWDHFQEQRELFVEVFQDFIPNCRTYVELDPTVRDKWGLPVARIYLGDCEHHHRAGTWLLDRGLELFDAMGADTVTRGRIGYLNPVLIHGTCRAGHDPATSVLNAFCQTHDIDNLFVVDGSFMPTSGGAPSTLTIVANSFRTADYILETARRGELS